MPTPQPSARPARSHPVVARLPTACSRSRRRCRWPRCRRACRRRSQVGAAPVPEVGRAVGGQIALLGSVAVRVAAGGRRRATGQEQLAAGGHAAHRAGLLIAHRGAGGAADVGAVAGLAGIDLVVAAGVHAARAEHDPASGIAAQRALVEAEVVQFSAPRSAPSHSSRPWRVPSPQTGAGPVQPLASKVQSVAHASVPPVKPRSAQLRPPKRVVSHRSKPSSVLSPHTGAVPVQPAKSQVQLVEQASGPPV